MTNSLDVPENDTLPFSCARRIHPNPHTLLNMFHCSKSNVVINWSVNRKANEIYVKVSRRYVYCLQTMSVNLNNDYVALLTKYILEHLSYLQ